MGNLASTYRNQGRWKEAEELEVQVMETRKRVLGQEHPDTLTSMGNLAVPRKTSGVWADRPLAFLPQYTAYCSSQILFPCLCYIYPSMKRIQNFVSEVFFGRQLSRTQHAW
jgi:hypothetical protein